MGLEAVPTGDHGVAGRALEEGPALVPASASISRATRDGGATGSKSTRVDLLEPLPVLTARAGPLPGPGDQGAGEPEQQRDEGDRDRRPEQERKGPDPPVLGVAVPGRRLRLGLLGGRRGRAGRRLRGRSGPVAAQHSPGADGGGPRRQQHDEQGGHHHRPDGHCSGSSSAHMRQPTRPPAGAQPIPATTTPARGPGSSPCAVGDKWWASDARTRCSSAENSSAPPP